MTRVLSPSWFPILGGRLLKKGGKVCKIKREKVSNPWREAIEDKSKEEFIGCKIVSNPWREAIEEGLKTCDIRLCLSFQSLEGGY